MYKKQKYAKIFAILTNMYKKSKASTQSKPLVTKIKEPVSKFITTFKNSQSDTIHVQKLTNIHKK